jgi:tetratricopeptide (TPR) repeat protein
MRPLLLAIALLTAAPVLAAPPAAEASIKKELGDTRRDAGDNTGALAAYREALQISPAYIEVWEEVGKLYFGAKKFSEAAEAFQRAVDIDASFANNWFNLALASRRAGDPSRSRDAFRRYLSLKPEDFEARLRLADVLKQLGERDAALKEYQAVLEASEARTVTPAIGEKAREAIALLRAAVPDAPAAAAPPPAAAPPALQPQAAPALPVAAPPVVQPLPPTLAPVAPPTLPPAAQASRPAVEPAAPPSPALLDKLALGDRLQTAGDYRGALFAFQDAVYLDPRHAVARVKLGRAYWILRYVGQADEQWQQASALAPNDPSIAHMIEEARKAPRPVPAGSEPPGAGQPASPSVPGGAGQGTGAAAAGGPRIYKFVPDSGAEPSPVVPPQGGSTPGYGMPPATSQGYPQPSGQPQYGQPPSPQPQYPQPQAGQPQYPQPQYGQQPQYAPPQYPQPQYGGQPQYGQPTYAPPGYAPAPAQPQYVPAAPQAGYPSQEAPTYATPAPTPQAPLVPASVSAAAQRYRTALSLYTQRDYLGAIAELDAAITLDPNLAVAYVARGSARFGLGKYRQAAADYKAALDLDPARAEPIWGLAECQRMLHDPAAPDTYRRYAASVAGDVNEDRRAKARRWAAELAPPPQAP